MQYATDRGSLTYKTKQDINVNWQISYISLSITITTSISANADGPHDAASCPIDHIVLHTVPEMDVKCIDQVTSSNDIESTMLNRPTAVGC